MKTSFVEYRSPIIEVDSIDQYGRKEKVRMFGVVEEPGEDVFAKVVGVSEKAAVGLTTNDVDVCHSLPGGSRVPKPLIAKIVRRDAKHQLMKHKGKLKENSIYLNDDMRPLRATITRDVRSKHDVRSFVIANEKNSVFKRDSQKLVFDNLEKLQKWDNELLSNVCKSLKKFSLGNLGISDKIFKTLGFLFYASLLMKHCGDVEKNLDPEIC